MQDTSDNTTTVQDRSDLVHGDVCNVREQDRSDSIHRGACNVPDHLESKQGEVTLVGKQSVDSASSADPFCARDLSCDL